MVDSLHNSFEEQILWDEAGNEVKFRGKLFSESSYFDEEQNAITRLKLFVTNDGRQVYSVVSGSGEAKWRRVYSMRIDGDKCHIENGSQVITLNIDMLLAVVFGLCGIDAAQGEALRAFIEDTRKIANG